MIVGIGSDIVQVKRIERVWQHHDNRFAERILTPSELDEFSQQSDPPRFLAKRFAAKEAVSKAIGTGFRQGVSWQDITITHDDLGKPQVALSGQALQVSTSRAIQHIKITISDEHEYVVAFAIAQAQ